MTVVTRKRSRSRTDATARGWKASLRRDDESVSVLGTVADLLDPPPDPYMSDPVGWVHDKAGEETWSKQDEILESVRDHPRTAVRSCHSAGKSHIASRVAAWWIDSHPVDEVFVVTTAPSTNQVKAILWRYIKAIHRKMKLPGYITEAEVPEWKVEGRLVAFGRKPQQLSNKEEAMAAFQGIHAKYVLVILDEAGGCPDWLWDAIQTLVTSPTNRVLAIGNPDDPTSRFAKVNEPGSGWHVIVIAAADTPAWTGEEVSEDLKAVLISREWVDAVRNDWGEDNPMFISKVYAEFPEVTDDVLITPAMIRKALDAFEVLDGTQQGRYAADIARMGKDRTVVYRNRGGVMEFVTQWIKKDTKQTTDRLEGILAPHQGGVPMVIDIGGGLGAGPFDALRHAGYPVQPFDGSQAALEQERGDGLRFQNRRSEQYWGLREEMDHSAVGINPKDLKLQAQLLNIKWGQTATGRIYIEKKEDIKKRTGESPDHADTVMMATVQTDEWELYSQDKVANAGPARARPKSETGDLMKRQF